MADNLVCIVCGNLFKGRSDRKWCTLDCKKSIKTSYDKDYHVAYRDTKIATACEWQRQNKERKQRYDQERRKTLPKRVRQYKPDPEARRQISAKRRAAKLNQGAYTVTKRDLCRALARSYGLCHYCSGEFTPDNPLEWDHVVPISRGGPHSIGNIVPACRECNRTKQIKFLVEWRYNRIVCVRGSVK